MDRATKVPREKSTICHVGVVDKRSRRVLASWLRSPMIALAGWRKLSLQSKKGEEELANGSNGDRHHFSTETSNLWSDVLHANARVGSAPRLDMIPSSLLARTPTAPHYPSKFPCPDRMTFVHLRKELCTVSAVNGSLLENCQTRGTSIAHNKTARMPSPQAEVGRYIHEQELLVHLFLLSFCITSSSWFNRRFSF